MIYRLPRNDVKGTRSSSYCFTVANKDDSSLIDLKSSIARRNAFVRKWCRANSAVGQYDKLYTVRLMARGPRRWHTKFGDMARYHKAQRGIPDHQQLLHGNADSNLNHRFAEEFDVSESLYLVSQDRPKKFSFCQKDFMVMTISIFDKLLSF